MTTVAPHNNSELTKTQTALIYDSETGAFSLVTPDSPDESVSPQALVLMGVFILLHEDQTFIEQVYNFAVDKFDSMKEEKDEPRIVTLS